MPRRPCHGTPKPKQNPASPRNPRRRRRLLRAIPRYPSLPPPARRRIHHPMDPAREPLAGGGVLQRRAAAASRSGGGPQDPPPRGQPAIHADVDPPPRPWPWMQKLAIVAIVMLGCLQFLPATHFRDPNDPQRNWIRIDGSRNPTVRYCAPRCLTLCASALFS